MPSGHAQMFILGMETEGKIGHPESSFKATMSESAPENRAFAVLACQKGEERYP